MISARSSDADIETVADNIWPVLGVSQRCGFEAVKNVALALRRLFDRKAFPPEAVLTIWTLAAVLSGASIKGASFRVCSGPLVTQEKLRLEIMSAARELGRIPGGRVDVMTAFYAGVALRALLRGGMAPDDAVTAISSLAMKMAGVND